MLRIISFEITDNKVIRVRSSHPVKNGCEIRDEIFFSIQDARAHVTKIRRDYLIRKFTDFVNHKKILFASSYGDHYRTSERLTALTRLLNAIELISNMNIQQLCSTIPNSRALLMKVLPHTANDSYESSLCDIHSMMKVIHDEQSNKLGLYPFKSTSRQVYLT